MLLAIANDHSKALTLFSSKVHLLRKFRGAQGKAVLIRARPVQDAGKPGGAR